MRVTFDEEPTPEDLEHYGVLGMKWGHRRVQVAQAKAAKAKSKLSGTERGTKAYSKANAKYQKATAKARTRKAVYEGVYSNAKARKRVERQSMGKTLAQAFVMGDFGAMKYNEARAAGINRGRSFVNGMAGDVANQMLFSLPNQLGGVAKASKVRKSLKSKA
jgi:hypothetical protein|nr:MAG TPA: hypothetical protein [Caudoviricetes sp.]